MRLAALPTSYKRRAQRMWRARSLPPAISRCSSSITTSSTKDTVPAIFSPSSPHKPVLDPQLPRILPAPMPAAVRTALDGGGCGEGTINDAWLQLKNSRGNDMDRDAFSGLPRIHQDRFAAFRRLGLPDHAAQRRLFTSPGCGASRSSAPTTPARILDVKYHVLLPRDRARGRFRSIIFNGRRSCRGAGAYSPIIGSIARAVKPWHVADLLILNRQMRVRWPAVTSPLVAPSRSDRRIYGRRGALAAPSPPRPSARLGRLADRGSVRSRLA